MKAPQWLRALEIPDACISQASSAGEGRRRFVIHLGEGDQIWRVKMDGCWLTSSDEKKVDYLFWGSSASGRKVILLVELKGKHFGRALEQVKSTLQRICKRADGRGIHTGAHQESPGHNLSEGVLAYVVLSKGKGVPQRQRERERIRQCYGVRVYPKSQRFDVNGIDALP
jgi:hypothetical protein